MNKNIIKNRIIQDITDDDNFFKIVGVQKKDIRDMFEPEMIEGLSDEEILEMVEESYKNINIINAESRKKYSGENAIELWKHSTFGCHCNTYATFRQWQKMRRKVRKGQHGVTIKKVIKLIDKQTKKEKTKIKFYVVFAEDQTEIFEEALICCEDNSHLFPFWDSKDPEQRKTMVRPGEFWY